MSHITFQKTSITFININTACHFEHVIFTHNVKAKLVFYRRVYVIDSNTYSILHDGCFLIIKTAPFWVFVCIIESIIFLSFAFRCQSP